MKSLLIKGGAQGLRQVSSVVSSSVGFVARNSRNLSLAEASARDDILWQVGHSDILICRRQFRILIWR